MWLLRNYNESPLVMRGCAGQYMQIIGNWDHFLSLLRMERVFISQDCMRRLGAPLHRGPAHGPLPARVDPMGLAEVFDHWNPGTPVPAVRWKKSSIHAPFGSVLNAADLTEPPLVTWADAKPGQQYALIMFDPDIPGHAEFWHWVVSDIPGTSLKKGEEEGDIGKAGRERWAYIPPSPSPHTGPHRYVIALFEQRGPLRITNGSTQQDRIREHIKLFSRTNPISTPRAVFVFKSEHEGKMVRL